MAFKADGEFICEIQFESGPVERPTDISINDDGVLAVTSMKGQVRTSSKFQIVFVRDCKIIVGFI